MGGTKSSNNFTKSPGDPRGSLGNPLGGAPRALWVLGPVGPIGALLVPRGIYQGTYLQCIFFAS